MKPRFLADADLNQKIVTGLRRREPSIDILDAHAGGTIGIADIEVLRLAAVSARTLLTHDKKTIPGHLTEFAREHSTAGVIIISQNLDIGSAIEYVLLIWEATDAEEWIDAVMYVPF